MKKTIRLTEGMLRQMVKEAIDELDWKTYASAADKQPSGYSVDYDENYKNGSEYDDEVEKVFQNKLKQLGLSSNELYNRDIDTWRDLRDDAEIEVATKERKMYQRQRNFRRSANDAFDRDFGFEDETGKIKSSYGRWDNGGMQLGVDLNDTNSNLSGRPNYFVTNQDFYWQNGSHTPGKWCVATLGLKGAMPQSPNFDTKEEAEEYAEMHQMPTKYVKPSKELQAAYQRARREGYNFDKRNYEYEKGNGWKLKNGGLDEAISKAIRKVLR